MKFRPDVEGLRAVAVLLVVLSHLLITGFSGGYVGVDIFFVISGYLITGLISSEYAKNAASNEGFGSFSLGTFYFRRVKRIVPMSLFVLLTTTATSYLLFNSTRAGRILNDSIWAIFFTANIHFINLARDYFQQGFSVSPIQHYWSLAVEEQFYLIVPGLFLLAVKRHGLRIFKVKLWWERRVGLLILAITIASLIWSIMETSSNPTNAYFSSLTRAWELGVGALLAISTMGGRDRLSAPLKTVASIIGLGLIIFSTFAYSASTKFPGIAAAAPVVGAAMIIYSGVFSSNPVSRILSTKPFTGLGRISYSVYLWHWPLIVTLNATHPSFLKGIVGKITTVMVTLLLSTLSYKFIEQPFRKIVVPQSRQKQQGGLRQGVKLFRESFFGSVFAIPILVISFGAVLAFSFLIPLKGQPLWTNTRLNPSQSITNLPKRTAVPITMWGDSMTESLSTLGPVRIGSTYSPTLFVAEGGASAAHIAALEGAYQWTGYIDKVLSKNPLTYQLRQVSPDALDSSAFAQEGYVNSWPALISGIPGILSRYKSNVLGAPNYTFTALKNAIVTPLNTKVQIEPRLTVEGLREVNKVFPINPLSSNTIIWLGRNGAGGDRGETLTEIVKKMIEKLDRKPNQKILVLPSFNGGIEIPKDNTSVSPLQSAFPNDYFDIRSRFIARAKSWFAKNYPMQYKLTWTKSFPERVCTNSCLGATKDSSWDVANGIPPRSLRIDNIHLNQYGNLLFREILLGELKNRGWLAQTSQKVVATLPVKSTEIYLNAISEQRKQILLSLRLIQIPKVSQTHLISKIDFNAVSILEKSTASKKIYLFGDSHARMLVPMLNAAYDPQVYSLQARDLSQCMVANVQMVTADNGVACSKHRIDFFAEMLRKRPDLTVLSDNAPASFLVDGRNQTYQTSAEWAARLEQTIRLVAQSSKHFVYFGQISGINGNFSECFDRSYFLVRTCIGNSNKFADVRNVEKKLTEKYGGFFIDPTDWVCADGLCPLIVHGLPVYIDSNHFNPDFSETLAPLWTDFMASKS